MTMKRVPLFAAVALLLAGAPALADGLPAAPTAACAAGLDVLEPDWLPLSCPQAFCNDDDDCRSLCPSDPGAACNLQTWTCTYTGSGSGGGGSCSSGSICSPARFCNDHDDCASCTGGCTGYCASDFVCRVV